MTETKGFSLKDFVGSVINKGVKRYPDQVVPALNFLYRNEKYLPAIPAILLLAGGVRLAHHTKEKNKTGMALDLAIMGISILEGVALVKHGIDKQKNQRETLTMLNADSKLKEQLTRESKK